MKAVILVPFFVVAAAFITNAAHASDGTINFEGRLITQTCTITVGGVVSPAVATVTLPTVSTNLLDAVGKVAGLTQFEIELSNCFGSSTAAAAFFESGADVDPESGELINSGTATNVRLQLIENSVLGETVIKAGDSSQQYAFGADIVGGNATIPYSVRYVAMGAAGAGTVKSTVTYSINYL